MRIATHNVNGINGRLANLLVWLEETEPDIVCLQELKAPDEKFPAAALRAAGYGAVWHGQKSWNGVAILARGAEPVETRRGLPGDPDDTHSRYIEAAIGGILVGCLYLPNGNPAGCPRPSPLPARQTGQKSWNGVAILARGAEPVETRRGLPGDPDDTHSRYIEAAIGGILVGCLYLPNGNPAGCPRPSPLPARQTELRPDHDRRCRGELGARAASGEFDGM